MSDELTVALHNYYLLATARVGSPAPSPPGNKQTVTKEKMNKNKQPEKQDPKTVKEEEETKEDAPIEAALPKSFARRDTLRDIEAEVRKQWDEAHVFEAEVDPTKEHFLVTFPYPYMNGPLHLGHAFTVTKADFAAAYHRLQGKNVLFPFGFHCTGMPIQAAANKLKRELDTYGIPPMMPQGDDDEGEDQNQDQDQNQSQNQNQNGAQSQSSTKETKEAGKFSSAKSKTTKKTGDVKLQWDILKMCNVPEEEIPKFVEPEYWLNYFPPQGEEDLRAFGLHCDWRRSFITTSANPYYDSFIRWQFTKLKEGGYINFGKRPTIYSELDGQACADHDRSSGEGVNPQEYTLIKLKVPRFHGEDQRALPGKLAEIDSLIDSDEKLDVFLVAATLRPETMYGQTNCFVLPDGKYGVFRINDQEAFICSERSARNMSYQNLARNHGQPEKIMDIDGKDLLALPLNAPLTPYEVVYTLPLLTISMNKGTGIVTSVPSDAPDDYAALNDLKEKPKLRERYGVTAEMVEPYAVVPVIELPEPYGSCSAVYVCQRDKIISQNDRDKLAKAKEEVYLKGFYQGIMIAGEGDGIKGMKVEEAKPKVRQIMFDRGMAVPYFEPENLVVSRSGDECVVAFLDQWFLKYGDEEWKARVHKHINDPANFSAYSNLALKGFNEILDWLKEWGCSRNFGLGTLLPWDEQFVIESLSDSTIYMAYYTVAHLLQGCEAGSYDGRKGGTLGIKPEQLSNVAWDYIFGLRDIDDIPGANDGCKIEATKLRTLRESFEYWYPMSLRVSGKDLIYNHLTMSLYNHAAIWRDRPELWPRSFYTNGHVQVDNLKMSKSLGNFIMMREAVSGSRTEMINGKPTHIGWSADATRFALADAGDGMDDANFVCETADGAILRLTTELEFFKTVLGQSDSKGGKGDDVMSDDAPFAFPEEAFRVRINDAIQKTADSYEAMRFREAIKNGFFELQIARDVYRDRCFNLKRSMNSSIVKRFIEVQIILISPVCPHFAEHVWKGLLAREGFVAKQRWPVTDSRPDDDVILAQDEHLLNCTRSFRLTVDRQMNAGKKNQPNDGSLEVTVYVSKSLPKWKQEAMTKVSELVGPDGDGATAKETKEQMVKFVKGLFENPDMKLRQKKEQKSAMAFAMQLLKDVSEKGKGILNYALKFDEYELLQKYSGLLAKSLKIRGVNVVRSEDAPEDDTVAAQAEPGKPTIKL